MSKPAPKKKALTTAEKITAMLRAREAGREAYARADELLDELEAEMTPGKPVVLADGQQAELVNQFAKKKKVWKPCGIRQFDVVVSRARDVTSKL